MKQTIDKIHKLIALAGAIGEDGQPTHEARSAAYAAVQLIVRYKVILSLPRGTEHGRQELLSAMEDIFGPLKRASKVRVPKEPEPKEPVTDISAEELEELFKRS